jgi:hypothetical protein
MADAGAAQPMTIFANVAFQHARPNTRILDLPHRTLHITPDVIIAIDTVGPLRPFHIRQQQEDTH